MDPLDTWSEYAFVISVYVVFLAALLTAIWKAVKRRFSPYWTLAIVLLVLGPAVFLSPIYAEIPVRYWDPVVNAGRLMLVSGLLAVFGGSVADGLRCRARRHSG